MRWGQECVEARQMEEGRWQRNREGSEWRWQGQEWGYPGVLRVCKGQGQRCVVRK
jgi:hypothetical protein